VLLIGANQTSQSSGGLLYLPQTSSVLSFGHRVLYLSLFGVVGLSSQSTILILYVGEGTVYSTVVKITDLKVRPGCAMVSAVV
jgi:hypothetical protein